MKKLIRFTVLIILILLASCVCVAHAEEQLPADIHDYFTESSFAGAEITDFTHWNDAGSNNMWFVLIRTKDGTNTLYCFTPKDSTWTKRFSTSAAIPQGKKRVEVSAIDTMTDYTTDKQFSGPILTISQMDEGDEYTELFTAYKLSSSGQWNLFRIWSYTDYGNMEIGDGYITYYKDLETPRVEGTAKGTFQRDLRYVSLSVVPRTYKQAKQKLTIAPTLPDGSELKATEIRFTGGKKYEVYSAPDKKSIRGGNGKAKVSTNGWIQVFGKENGWILIQYSIDSEHYRFGYISEKALPKKAAVEDLQFSTVSAVIGYPVSVTDDPLFSQNTLTTLTGGETVTWLANVGDWAYIEGTDFRGFIPADALAFPSSFEEGYEIYTGNDGEKYDLFEIRKLFYDEHHKVYAVSGVYERVALDDDCYYGKIAENSAFTYDLAPDFHAEMMNPESQDPFDPNVPVSDLYSWYIAAYRNGEEPADRDLVFQYDLPEDQQENAEVDFWFVTTRIRLNNQQQIEYMQYYYVPWG